MASRALRRSPRELGYRERQVLPMIQVWNDERGFSPSLDEIKDALGFYDKAGVLRVVRRLEKRGLVSRVGAGKVRGRGVRIFTVVN